MTGMKRLPNNKHLTTQGKNMAILVALETNKDINTSYITNTAIKFPSTFFFSLFKSKQRKYIYLKRVMHHSTQDVYKGKQNV